MENQFDNETVVSILRQHIDAAESFKETELTISQRRAVNRYMGRPEGNEISGRSQVVSQDLLEIVEWTVPSVMRVFFSGDKIANYIPENPEKEEECELKTDFINKEFTDNNNGFQVVQEVIRTALTEKVGFAHICVEDKMVPSYDVLNGVSEQDLLMLGQNPNIEIRPVLQNQDGTYKIEIKTIKKKSGLKLYSIKPEDVLIDVNATNDEDLRFAAIKEFKTRSDLIAEGYDPDLVMSLPAVLNSYEATTIERGVSYYTREQSHVLTQDKSRELVEVHYCYIEMDYDGDGIAELRKIVLAGKNEVLVNEPIDDIPLISCTPFPVPYSFYGLSLDDMINDLHTIRTAVLRQMMDNIYYSNNAKTLVGEDADPDIEALLSEEPGTYVRCRNPGAIVPLVTQSLVPQLLQTLGYIDDLAGTRTGVTKFTQSLDANLVNKTATGMVKALDAQAQRLELLCRNLSETFFKRLFRILLKYTVKYLQVNKQTKINGRWVQVDASSWSTDDQIEVSVGLGAVNKDAMTQNLMGLLNIQKEILQFQGGLEGPLVNIDNIYNTLTKVVESVGLKAEEQFFMRPDPQTMQPKPEQPSEKQLEIAEKQRHQEKEHELAMQKMVFEFKMAQKKAEQERKLAQEKMLAEIALQQNKLAAEIELKNKQLKMEAKLKEKGHTEINIGGDTI